MLCCFFLLLTAVVVATHLPVPLNSRARGDVQKYQQLGAYLQALIDQDLGAFHKSSQDELDGRADWLIRVFEIGTDGSKRRIQRQQELLRFFRQTAHVFSPHTDYVSLANSLVPVIEEIEKRIEDSNYDDPLEVLKRSYRAAFTQDYLKMSSGARRAVILKAIEQTRRLAELEPTLLVQEVFFKGGQRGDEEPESQEEESTNIVAGPSCDEGDCSLDWVKEPYLSVAGPIELVALVSFTLIVFLV